MRTAAITGVSRGLGAELSLALAAAGVQVAGCARSREALAALSGRLGPEHRFSVVDVSRPREVEHWAEEVCRDHGVPELVVNNAGLINRPAALWQLEAEEIGAVVDVNVKGVLAVAAAFLRRMVAAGSGGVLVNLSSTWGRTTAPEVTPYCASKWAVEGLSRALSQEVPPGIAVVSLNPGVIDTDMLRQVFFDGAAGYPDAVDWAARAAPYLLSLGPSDNGAALTVPG